MALPFGAYEGQDLTEYEAGNKFLPRQFYSLNYTPSQKLASTIGNTGGVTGTQAAYPYIWPPQGGGGGGGGFSNTNKFGLNLDTQKTISSGKYVEQGGPGNMYGGDYVKTDRQIAQDEHGNWKDVNTNQNVYHGNIGYKGLIGTVVDAITGKSKNRDDRIGTWTGAEWDEDIDANPKFAGKRLNTYQRWKAKKVEEAAASKAGKDAADAAATGEGTNIGGGWTQTNTGGGGATFTGRGGQTHKGWSNTPEGFAAAAESEASFARGGRIGLYAGGDPEEPAEDIREVMQDQNIPFSEQVEGEGGILEQLVAKYIEAGFPPDQAEEMAMEEFQQMSMGSEQGIASLV